MIADRSSAAIADALGVIQDEGGTATGAVIDVARAADHEQMVTAALHEYGKLDILVSNAGVGSVAKAADLSESEWNRVISTNLTGVWLGARQVIPHMQRQGAGAIVNMASITGLHGYPGVAAYSAAKGGVLALTRQIAADYASAGIRANTIVPGTVHTPLTQGLWDSGGGFGGSASNPEEQIAAAAKGYPLGRLGTAEDIANMALFLGSDEAAWITGGMFVVDGGKISC